MHGVVDEFGHRQQEVPVILLIVPIDPKILFQRLVDPLCLAVALGVVSSGSVTFYVEHLQEMSSEFRNEL